MCSVITAVWATILGREDREESESSPLKSLPKPSQDRQTPGREGKIIFFSKKLVYFSGVKLRKLWIEENLGNRPE